MKVQVTMRALLAAGVAMAMLLAGCGDTTNPTPNGPVAAAQPRSALSQAAPALSKSSQQSDTPSALVAEKAGVVSAPVFRFAKISNGAYFFTGSAGEKDIILNTFPDFRCEGLAFFRTSDNSGVPVYRFANLVNGGYFFTASAEERDFVQATRPDMRFEGSTFSVVTAETAGATPVYRLANLSNGAYLYTRRSDERDYAVSLGNWRNEGIAFYSAPVDDALASINYCLPPGTVPVVASVAASSLPLKYLAPVAFRVVGTNLDAGITFTSTGCASITEFPGATATTRTFACAPSTTGPVTFRVLGPDGTTSLFNASATIGQPQVKLATSMGDIVLQLDPAKAPITVANFLQYVRDGFYSGLIFHRVTRTDFSIIQGGGLNSALLQKITREAITLESQNGLSNIRGTIAMARTSAANSATSQFFINVSDNVFFDYFNAANPGYAVFGAVVQGQDVVDAINAVPTGSTSGLANVPLTPITINSATQTQ